MTAKAAYVMQAIILAYHCGVPLQTLAGWYRKGQSPA